MKIDDPKNYTPGRMVNTDCYDDLWNYGKEIWCNMKGQFVSIVADFSSLSGQQYSASICSLGLMGAEYIRDSQIPDYIEVN